jgi:hypothetical protein
VAIIAAAAAAAAMFAPARLTGNPWIDLAERSVVAGGITFMGAHGRRWAWVVSGALIALPARGFSLALALVGLSLVVGAAVPRRRSKPFGAVALAFLTNAALWYPPSVGPIAPALAAAGCLAALVTSTRYMRPRVRRTARRTVFTAAGLVAVIIIVAGLIVGLSFRHVVGGTRAARLALGSARSGEADVAAARLNSAQVEFKDAASLLEGPAMLPSLLVPGLAQQVRAVRVGVREGRRISRSATDLVATANYDKLTYAGSIDLDRVMRLQEPTRRVTDALTVADHNLSTMLSGRLVPALHSRLAQFSEAVESARSDASLASSLLDVSPGLLGGSGPRHYLVIFTTPAELRGAGGFVGSYAEIEASAGRTRLTRSGRIEDLINAAKPGTRTISGPPDYLRRYSRFNPSDQLQDVTLSPDFPSDAQVFAELYPQSGGRPVDGVISVDPTGLAALLKLTGPVAVAGLVQPLDAQNAVDILTRTQYLDLPDRSERGEILTGAVRSTFERLTKGALPSPRRLADVLSPATRGGHLRLWSPDRHDEQVFRRLGADGVLQVPAGSDGFSVVQQNVGNNKIDAYLHRSIRYQISVDARTGHLTAQLEIVLHNDVPNLALPLSVVGNTRGQPLGTNVATLSIYSPQVVTGSRIDGRPAKLGPDTEKGLNVYDTPELAIPPGGSVRVKLELAGTADLRQGYHLLVLPQPVANPDRFDVSLTVLNGRTDRGAQGVLNLLEDRPLTAPSSTIVSLRPND